MKAFDKPLGKPKLNPFHFPWQRLHTLLNTKTEMLEQSHLLWMMASYSCILLLLFPQLTPLNIALFILSLIWRFALLTKQTSRPPTWSITLLALLMIAVMIASYRQLDSLSLLINLLSLGYIMKFTEMRYRRDAKSLVLIGYFLIALIMLEPQSMLSSVLIASLVLLNTASLIHLFHGKNRVFDPLLSASKICLVSFPLALLLFILIPRLPPLWSVPQLKSTATGLSDNISLGDIEQLTMSADLSFRAQFTGAIPRPEQRYWRTLILDQFDGQSWQQSQALKTQQQKAALSATNQRLTPEQVEFRYQVLHEPTQQHWLPSLGISNSNHPQIRILADNTLYAKQALYQPLQYQVQSNLSLHHQQPPSAYLRLQNLAVPSHLNPKTQAYAKQLLLRYPHPLKRLQMIMASFQQQAYYYTLSPPPLGEHQIDDFLFRNQQGFCMHYASSMVVLARLTGIPARIVTGYQGGEQIDNRLHVYQYMAHAWLEAWLPELGWVSFDPTSMVAPERVLEGFDALFSAEQTYLQDSLLSPFLGESWAWLSDLRAELSQLDHQFRLWILHFDQQKQQQLWQVVDQSLTDYVLLALLVGLLFFIAIKARLKNQSQPASLRQTTILQYTHLLNLLKRCQVPLATQDAPMTVAEKMQQLADDKQIYQPIARQLSQLMPLLQQVFYQEQEQEQAHQQSAQSAKLTQLNQHIHRLHQRLYLLYWQLKWQHFWAQLKRRSTIINQSDKQQK